MATRKSRLNTDSPTPNSGSESTSSTPTSAVKKRLTRKVFDKTADEESSNKKGGTTSNTKESTTTTTGTTRRASSAKTTTGKDDATVTIKTEPVDDDAKSGSVSASAKVKRPQTRNKNDKSPINVSPTKRKSLPTIVKREMLKRRNSAGRTDLADRKQSARLNKDNQLRSGRNRKLQIKSPEKIKVVRKRRRASDKTDDDHLSDKQPSTKRIKLEKKNTALSDSELMSVVSGGLDARRRSDSISKCSDQTDSSSIMDIPLNLLKEETLIESHKTLLMNAIKLEPVEESIGTDDNCSTRRTPITTDDDVDDDIGSSSLMDEMISDVTNDVADIEADDSNSKDTIKEVYVKEEEESIEKENKCIKKENDSLCENVEVTAVGALKQTIPEKNLKSASPVPASEAISAISVKNFYGQPDFLENNLGIEQDLKLADIVQVREKTKLGDEITPLAKDISITPIVKETSIAKEQTKEIESVEIPTVIPIDAEVTTAKKIITTVAVITETAKPTIDSPTKVVTPTKEAIPSKNEVDVVVTEAATVAITTATRTVPATTIVAANIADILATEPVLKKSETTEIAKAEPETFEPVKSVPAATELATTESAITESVATEPAATESAATEPAATESAATEPAVTEPATIEPAATEPIAIEPAAKETAATIPTTAELSTIDAKPEPTAKKISTKTSNTPKNLTLSKSPSKKVSPPKAVAAPKTITTSTKVITVKTPSTPTAETAAATKTTETTPVKIPVATPVATSLTTPTKAAIVPILLPPEITITNIPPASLSLTVPTSMQIITPSTENLSPEEIALEMELDECTDEPDQMITEEISEQILLEEEDPLPLSNVNKEKIDDIDQNLIKSEKADKTTTPIKDDKSKILFEITTNGLHVTNNSPKRTIEETVKSEIIRNGGSAVVDDDDIDIKLEESLLRTPEKIKMEDEIIEETDDPLKIEDIKLEVNQVVAITTAAASVPDNKENILTKCKSVKLEGVRAVPESPETIKQKENHLLTLGLLTHRAAVAAQIEKQKRRELMIGTSSSSSSSSSSTTSRTIAKANKSADYTGTLKTVIKLHRPQSVAADPKVTKKTASRAAGTLKMTLHKGRGGRAAATSNNSTSNVDSKETSATNSEEDTYYTIQNEVSFKYFFIAVFLIRDVTISL